MARLERSWGGSCRIFSPSESELLSNTQNATKLETHKADLQNDLARALENMRRELAEEERVHRERWGLKRDACLAALGLVDKVFTNVPWEDRTRPSSELRITRSPVDPAEFRTTMNRLILTCDDPIVVHLFLRCIGLHESGEPADSVDPGDLQILRNAVRRELGFGTDLELNPNLSWITSVHGDGVVDTERKPPATQQGAEADREQAGE